MNIVDAIILGVVEGITEFLPISSTAHLIIVSKWLGSAQTDFQKFFEVFIQSGAILAVIFLYFQHVLKHRKLIRIILISFIPTAVVGLLLHKVIKAVFFESYLLIATALLGIGLLFIVIEQLIKNEKLKLTNSIDEINFKDAFIIGAAQSLAVVPGVSRAGIVMLIMMSMGYKRDETAVYSFLLAVPTIIAASVFDFYKVRGTLHMSQEQILYLSVGFLLAFATAHITMKWFINYLKSNSLIPFAVYRITLAIILLAGL